MPLLHVTCLMSLIYKSISYVSSKENNRLVVQKYAKMLSRNCQVYKVKVKNTVLQNKLFLFSKKLHFARQLSSNKRNFANLGISNNYNP